VSDMLCKRGLVFLSGRITSENASCGPWNDGSAPLKPGRESVKIPPDRIKGDLFSLADKRVQSLGDDLVSRIVRMHRERGPCKNVL
jgi:hypothetical protein